jgi:uncharacterized membrane protein YidH (DUF202 family)
LPEKKLDCGFYLANERIFLKWGRTMIFVGSVGLTFFNRGLRLFVHDFVCVKTDLFLQFSQL